MRAPSVIYTADLRLRVIPSSSFEELIPGHGAARETVTSLHLNPIMFEPRARRRRSRPLP
jgi:hypothetical protein